MATMSAFAAACGSDGDGRGDDDGEVFTSSPVDVDVDDIFSIELESNPSTGYSWELAAPLDEAIVTALGWDCLLYTSPSPRDISGSRMPSSA